MIDGKRVLAVIPARGGSKRLPGKNLRSFLGLPLFGWSVVQAGKSSYVDNCVLSTEDEEISKLAISCGMLVLKRPAELSTDEASLNDVLSHALKEYQGYDLAVVLQPTSPLRAIKDIDCAIELGFSISVGPDGRPNGAVYCVEVPFFLRYPYFGGRVFYMPKDKSVDINTEEDFKLAEEYGRQNRA